MFAMPATTPLSTDLLIAENLFCFWELVGRCSKTLQVEEDYSFINLLQSDWPRRIFRLRQNIEASSIAILMEKMQTGVLPHRITLAEYDAAIPLLENAGLVQVFSQKGMAIQLNDAQLLEPSDAKFIQVKTQVDAARFAMVASTSFGYWVAPTMMGSLVGQSSVVMLLGLVDGSEACCGLAFFDSSGHAGLHMIGTLPEYRGRGLGHLFFDVREKHAVENGFRTTAFCSVVRPENHPLKPAGYRPNDAFWNKRGYVKTDYFCTLSWLDRNETEETPKELIFWTREWK